MSDFVIITDSTCDLPKDVMDANSIDYAKMNFVIDEKEYKALLDWSEITPKDFYDTMRNGTRITTTQVPIVEFVSVFTKYAEKGCDILYIACSSALSGSVKTSFSVAEDIKKSFPNIKIRCVDSLISTLGQGFIVLEAARLRDEGKSLDEVADYIEGMRLTVNQIATVETLEYLKRSGRVSATSAFFGNFFGIKPILISDKIGQNLAVKKVKGLNNCFVEMAKMVAERVINPENQVLYIAHADSIDNANQLKDEILKLCPFKSVFMNYVGPIVGASVGPGMLCSFFTGKEVTEQGGAE